MIFKIIIKNTLVKNALKNWAKNKMQNMRTAKLNLHFFKKKHIVLHIEHLILHLHF